MLTNCLYKSEDEFSLEIARFHSHVTSVKLRVSIDVFDPNVWEFHFKNNVVLRISVRDVYSVAKVREKYHIKNKRACPNFDKPEWVSYLNYLRTSGTVQVVGEVRT